MFQMKIATSILPATQKVHAGGASVDFVKNEEYIMDDVKKIWEDSWKYENKP